MSDGYPINDLYIAYFFSSSGSVFRSGTIWCSYSRPNTSSGISYVVNNLLPRSPQNVSVLWALPTGYTTSTWPDWTAEIYEGSTLLASTSLLSTSMTAHGSAIHFTPSSSAVTLMLHPTTSTSSILVQSITYDSITYTPGTAFATICDDDQYRYGYNGKLKDNEYAGLGNSLDYSARRYRTREARFPSPDPKKASFPHKSPYVAFSDNPLVFTDPSGKTDFYFNGKCKGTDGVNNGLIGVLGSNGVARQVAAACKDGNTYADFGELKNGTSNNQLAVIHRDILKQAVQCLYMALSKGANCEYSYGMKKNAEGGYSTTYTHVGQDYDLTKPERVNGGSFSRDLDVTIHSHPTGVQGLGFSPLTPTTDNGFGVGDAALFSHHEMNVIVGKDGKPLLTGGTVEDMRSSAIMFMELQLKCYCIYRKTKRRKF
jgi:RHS repeat-associated protein